MKNEKGVSLITLIITIIVVIILAVIVLRSGASSAPDQANFSKFTQEMGELQDAVNLAMLTAKGEEQLKGNQRTEAQLYNFVARGGYEGFEAERKSFMHDVVQAAGISDDEKWLTQNDAEERIKATQIMNKEIAEKIYNKKLDGIKNFGIELPNRKVETAFGVGQEVVYFVTPGGNVFCWPPYVYDGKSYVNANTTVKSDVEVTNGVVSNYGSKEMGETTATETKDNGEEYDVIIAFENGEYVKIKNGASGNGDNYIMTHNVFEEKDTTVLELVLSYGVSNSNKEKGKIKIEPIIFSCYNNTGVLYDPETGNWQTGIF